MLRIGERWYRKSAKWTSFKSFCETKSGGNQMRYKLLGKSGLRVSELCLGTMTFGEDWGWGSSKDESRMVYEAFLEAGGNFIDTANVYTNGTSEQLLGE
jgi:diketogulonate reductase-like aldo/keto reductase